MPVVFGLFCLCGLVGMGAGTLDIYIYVYGWGTGGMGIMGSMPVGLGLLG